MKLLVSDYDDTFYINDDDIKLNVKLIQKFMKNNIFVIATGRSYLDFKKVEEKYNIKYNYLVINHGTTIIKDNKIIKNYYFNDDIKNEILKYINKNKFNIDFISTMLNKTKNIENEKITKIALIFDNTKKTLKIKKKFEKKFNVKAYVVNHGKGLEIVPSNVDKANCIDIIKELCNIDYDNIYTVGNGNTDIEMIKRYDGYAIKNSIASFHTNKVCDSVSELIKELL